MLAQHVAAQTLNDIQVEQHGLLGGWGVQAIRPVALVERAELEKGAVVQAKAGAPEGIRPQAELAHGEVAGDLVLSGHDGQIVEMRIGRAPQLGIGDLEGELACARFSGSLRHQQPGVKGADMHGTRFPLQPNLHPQGA